jgi:hypothetical protein
MPNNSQKKELSRDQVAGLLKVLQDRFEKNMSRHKALTWEKIQSALHTKPEKLWSLNEMERTGGEPDAVGVDIATGEYLFFDCSQQTPKGRCNLCYDQKGWLSRKEHRPENNAVELASEMGIELLTQAQYRSLQKLAEFDTKTSSWLKTPESIRKLGGALFGDFRYGATFVYHNGAESYYAVRGFRGVLRV